MSIQTAGTAGPSYRQRPGQPHIVETQPRPGARWIFEAECKSARAAQEWIWQKAKSQLIQQQQGG